MNGDGYFDIVVGKDGTTDDLIYINNGAGSFSGASLVHLPAAGQREHELSCTGGRGWRP